MSSSKFVKTSEPTIKQPATFTLGDTKQNPHALPFNFTAVTAPGRDFRADACQKAFEEVTRFYLALAGQHVSNIEKGDTRSFLRISNGLSKQKEGGGRWSIPVFCVDKDGEPILNSEGKQFKYWTRDLILGNKDHPSVFPQIQLIVSQLTGGLLTCLSGLEPTFDSRYYDDQITIYFGEDAVSRFNAFKAKKISQIKATGGNPNRVYHGGDVIIKAAIDNWRRYNASISARAGAGGASVGADDGDEETVTTVETTTRTATIPAGLDRETLIAALRASGLGDGVSIEDIASVYERMSTGESLTA